MAKAPVKSRAARKRTATKIARGAATREQKKAMPKKTSAKKTSAKKTTAKKIPKGKIGLAVAGIGTVLAGANALRNKPKSFGEAFKKARKNKGPNSTFTYKGKKYSTVTKDQIKKAGFTNLRDYLNSKKKK
jgi:mannitol-specific phosphotransferase system IIBC component